MDRRIVHAGIVFVLLLSAFIVVQILDPQFGEREPPEVDFSEPPNEIAADAATQFEYVDYAYRVDTRYNGSDGWRQFIVTQVDHTNGAYRSVGPGGEDETVIYGMSAAAFVRPSIGEDWVILGDSDVVYPVKYLTQPVFVERLRAANGEIVSSSQSTMSIHVDVNPLKIGEGAPGNATVTVNTSTGMIESVHVAYDPGRMETHYLRLEIIGTRTTVERPKSIEFSPQEAFWDLLRGPLFRIEWIL